MAKRTSEAAELPSPASKQTTTDRTAPKNGDIPEDEGMGEFEDRYEDDIESDEEVVGGGEDEQDEDEDEDDVVDVGDADAIRFSDKILPAPEDADDSRTSPAPQVYLPTSRPLAADEILEPDNSVYLALHQLSYNWPCLSFDVLRDSGGWERSKFPHTAWVVAGTQAGEEISAPGSKAKDEIVVMRWGGLSKTQKDGDDSDDDEDEDDPDEVDEDAHLEYLSIPHVGSVNRVRAQPMALSPELLPPPSTPYHVASWSETGKVHIWDIRPLMEQLDSPATAQPRTEKTRRPVYTVMNHGRAEGFALDWAMGSSTSDLRLLTGDIASQIYLTTTTQTGFDTQANPFLSHTSSVEDLQWSPSEPTVFASCSADRSLRVWDVRVKNRKSVVALEDSHEQDVNVISWNKNVEYLLVSGGDEGGLKVWDLRNFKSSTGAKPSPVAQFDWHKSPITSVEWHPSDSSTFAAASADDSVTLWDLAVEADDDEASTKAISEQGIIVPPQLLFVHQGQKDVKEVHWHPQIPGMVCSTAGDGFNAFKTISV